MDYGWTSLCLPARDLDRSKRFNEALGMEVLEEIADRRVILRNGPFRLALMSFLESPLLNWRGADAFAVHAAASSACPQAPGEPRRYRAGEPDTGADADGACWATRDPDGHEILFDSHELETSAAGRAERIRREPLRSPVGRSHAARFAVRSWPFAVSASRVAVGAARAFRLVPS